MESVGKWGTRVKVHSWNIFLVFFRTAQIIPGLYLSLQDVLKFHRLVRVVVEETTCIHQVEEQFREIILKDDSPFLTCSAVRSCAFIRLPYNSFTRVDKAALTRSSRSEHTDSEFCHIIYCQAFETFQLDLVPKFVVKQLSSTEAQFVLQTQALFFLFSLPRFFLVYLSLPLLLILC